MRERFGVIFPVVLLIAAALGGQPALAKGPVTERYVPQPATTLDGLCSFPITFEEVNSAQWITTWPNGKMRIEGPTSTKVTNVDTGASRLLDSSGTVTITPHGDGSTTISAEGRSIFFFFPGDLGAGQDGAVWWMSGVFVERFTFVDDVFTLVSYRQKGGTREDLCVTLAGGG